MMTSSMHSTTISLWLTSNQKWNKSPSLDSYRLKNKSITIDSSRKRRNSPNLCWSTLGAMQTLVSDRPHLKQVKLWLPTTMCNQVIRMNLWKEMSSLGSRTLTPDQASGLFWKILWARISLRWPSLSISMTQPVCFKSAPNLWSITTSSTWQQRSKTLSRGMLSLLCTLSQLWPSVSAPQPSLSIHSLARPSNSWLMTLSTWLNRWHTILPSQPAIVKEGKATMSIQLIKSLTSSSAASPCWLLSNSAPMST